MQKHHFEAVSLLTAGKGALKVAVISAEHQPDWLVPFALILDSQVCDEAVDVFDWQHQNQHQVLPVYPLVSQASTYTMVVLEGVADAHRIVLQTNKEVETMRVRISEVKDVQLSQEDTECIKNATPQALLKAGRTHFAYQAVMIGQNTYIIPDLDAIAEALAA